MPARTAISALCCSIKASSSKRSSITIAPSRSILVSREAHSNRGNALQRLKRFTEAEEAYRRAIELQPKFADAWNNLGTCLRELKRPEEAETAYRKALELNPEQSRHARQSRARGPRTSNGSTKRRICCAARWSSIAQSDKLHLHYGTVLLDQNKADEAAAAIERALRAQPQQSTMRSI